MSPKWLITRVKPTTTNNSLASTPSSSPDTLDFDLHDQLVAVVIGGSGRQQEITDLIHAHHGRVKIIDAFYRQTNRTQHFENEIKDANILIMIQNQMKHGTSKTITAVASRYDINFAIAKSGGLQAIEQAVYRADQGIKSYEASGSTISYPIKSD